MDRLRSILPLLAGLACLSAFTALALQIRSQERHAVRVRLEEMATNTAFNLTDRVNTDLAALERMAGRWIAAGRTEETAWRSDARAYVADQPELQAIQWANPEYRLAWVEPEAGNERVLGLDILFEEYRAQAVMEAVNNRRMNTSAAIDLLQGGSGFLTYFPLYTENGFDGLIVGVFNIPALVDTSLPPDYRSIAVLEVHEGGRLIHAHGEAASAQFSSERTVALPGSVWRITLLPSRSLLAAEFSGFPGLVFGLGVVLALAIGVVLQFLRSSREHAFLLSLEHSAAVDELQRNRERMALAVRGSSDGFWDWDIARDELYHSPRLCQMLGGPEESVVTDSSSFAERLHPDDRVAAMESMRAHLRTGSEYNAQARFRCEDGNYRWFRIRGLAQRRDDGTPVRMAGSITDITDLVETSVRADAANRAKSEFLANMSHEIRTPMNGILGMARVLGSQDLPDDTHRKLEVIIQSGDALMHLLDDILDLSKIEAGRVELEEAPFCLSALTQRAQTLYEPAAERKGLNFRVSVRESDRVLRFGDALRISQITNNLVSNAVKFTETGEIEMIAGPDADTGGIRLVVRDTGVGMTPEQRRSIFEKVVQADSSTTRRFGGTGLGLAICKGLVQHMGGTIEVDSTPGQGTQFTVVLPIPVTEGQAAATSPAEATLQPDRPLVLDGRKARVLAAEDNQINRFVLQAYLAQLDVEVDMVEDGRAAVEAFKQTDYDIVLLDIQMPVMNGEDALTEIRRFERENKLVSKPVMALTANVMPDQVNRYTALGFDAHTEKPIDPAALEATMRRLITGYQLRRDAQPSRKSAG